MRTYLDEQIGTAPPTSIDMDRLITRERRRARYRRIGTPLAAGAGVALATAVAVATFGTGGADPGRPGTGQRPGAGGTVTPSGGAPSTSAPAVPRAPEDPAATADRLTQALRDAVRRVAPQVTAAQAPRYPTPALAFTPREVPLQQPGVVLSPGATRPKAYVYDGGALLTDAAGKGVLMIGVSSEADAVGVPTECRGEPGQGTEISCEKITGPHGETIIKSVNDASTANRSQNTGGKPGAVVSGEPMEGVTYFVYLRTAAGAGVALIVDDGNDKSRDKIGRPSPVLTFEQMIQIATDPVLSFQS